MEKSLDFQALFGSPFRDNYGRCYPYNVFLQNGDEFTGAYAGSSSSGEKFDKIWFKHIEDLNEWVTNKEYIGTKMIYLKPEEIKDLVLYDKLKLPER